MPAAQEPFRPAVLRRPLRPIRVTVVIRLLHHALLVLGRQHRQDRRNLHVPHPKPVLVLRARGMQVAPRPLAGHGRVRVLGGAAAPARLLEQCLVMLLRGLERVRAHDRLARVIAVAITPRRRLRRILADQPILAPEILERGRAVAAEVARIAPQIAILVEVRRREQIHRRAVRCRTASHRRAPNPRSRFPDRAADRAESACAGPGCRALAGASRRSCDTCSCRPPAATPARRSRSRSSRRSARVRRSTANVINTAAASRKASFLMVVSTGRAGR